MSRIIVLLFLCGLSISCGGGSRGSIESTTPSAKDELMTLDYETPMFRKLEVVQDRITYEFLYGEPIEIPKEDSVLRVKTMNGIELYSTYLEKDELTDRIQINAVSSFLENVLEKEGLGQNKSILGITYWFDIPSVNKSYMVYDNVDLIKNTFGPIVNRLTLLDMLYELGDIQSEVGFNNRLREAILNNGNVGDLVEMILDSRSSFNVNYVALENKKPLENGYYVDSDLLAYHIKNENREELAEILVWAGGLVEGVIEGATQQQISIYSYGDLIVNTTTDDLGSYSIFLPIPGEFTIEPTKEGFSFLPKTIKVTNDHGIRIRSKNFESYTGSVDVPSPEDVVLGVEYTDASGQKVVGKFKPVNPLTDVEYYRLLAAGQVEYTLIDGSTVSAQFTLPDPSIVKLGETYGTFDEFEGTYVATNSNTPSTGNVLYGTVYTSSEGVSVTGTYKPATVPDPQYVLSGINYTTADGLATEVIGTFSMPSENLILDSISYTSNNGLLTKGTASVPVSSDVLAGVMFSDNTGNNTIGTLVLPSAGQVEEGINYGPSGAYMGTLQKATSDLSSGNFTGNITGSVNILGIQFPDVSTASNGQILVFDSSGSNLYFTDLPTQTITIDNTITNNNTIDNSTNTTIISDNTNGITFPDPTTGSNGQYLAFDTSGDNLYFASVNTTVSYEDITGSPNIGGLIYPTVDGANRSVMATDGQGNITLETINTLLNGATLSSDNLTVSNLTVSDNTTIGDSLNDDLNITSTIKGGSSGGNIWFQGNIIASSNQYTLGTASTEWESIYAVRLVTTSDERKKENIEELGYGLNEVMALEPVKYDWKHRKYPTKTIGLLAQDVEDVIPEVVENNQDNYSIHYLELIPVLINSIKEQQRAIERLEAELNELKGLDNQTN